jgi:uncharacterized membrane protein
LDKRKRRAPLPTSDRVPEGGASRSSITPAVPEAVGRGLLEEWPTYMAYLVSFSSIGAAWVAHSTITGHLDRVDPTLLRLDLMLLFLRVAADPVPCDLPERLES